MAGLRFTSSGDAAASLAGDEKVKQQVDEEICCSQLVNTLLQLRIEKGISQKELAKRIGCDPSKISRLEAGNDLQLKIGDVRQYLSALDVTMNMVFEDTSLPVAKKVDGDEVIINKIHVFCSEVLFNFLSRVGDKRFMEKDSVIKHARPNTVDSIISPYGRPFWSPFVVVVMQILTVAFINRAMFITESECKSKGAERHV